MNSFFDKFKKKPTTTTPPKAKPKKTPKELATEAGEPWVEVISMDIDPDDVGMEHLN